MSRMTNWGGRFGDRDLKPYQIPGLDDLIVPGGQDILMDWKDIRVVFDQ